MLFRKKKISLEPKAEVHLEEAATCDCADITKMQVKLQNIHLYCQLAEELAESSVQKEYLQVILSECTAVLEELKK